MTHFHAGENKSGSQHHGGGAFPLPALIALALSGFITILTEALPAGLLSQIAEGLSVSQTAAGQMVTAYAIGSLLAAIPLTRATQGWRRRPLLTLAIAGFALANLVTAFSPSYILTMAARFIAGVSAGLLWALLAGYAARMVPDAKRGRAIAVAMAGTPLALSVGVPTATFLGTFVGWRTCFASISVAAALLMMWVATRLPDFPGQTTEDKKSLMSVGKLPGVASILFVTLTFVLAHNLLYTYIVPLLHRADMQSTVDIILLIFGCCSLASIWLVGIAIDRRMRALAIITCGLFITSALMFGVWPASRTATYLAVGLWGLAFGGAATIFQTAIARAAPRQTDVAQSMLVTAWNLAIAGGGLMGGALLESGGVSTFPPAVLALLIPCGLVIFADRRSAFKSRL